MKILVTGALGQIGSDLTLELKKIYGQNNVIASDILPQKKSQFEPYEILNVLDKDNISSIIKKHDIKIIYHLAAILSANGEKNSNLCFNVNINGLHNILEACRNFQLKQVICPSSIAVFGPQSPAVNTPQQTILLPETMYGLTKVAGELLCDYYVKKHKIDVRGLRYPGLISHKALPGGGTTDYAVEIFYEAIQNNQYNCFLASDTILPMMYIDDAIRGTIELSQADFKKLTDYANFNFAAMSFSCQELADEITKYIPDFKITYSPDYRQEIANSWPKSIDDSQAQSQWNWKAEYDIAKMCQAMMSNLTTKLSNSQ